MIIGLSGYAQSGKDEIANILVKEYGYERIAFADSIRDLLGKLTLTLEDGMPLEMLVRTHDWEYIKKNYPSTRKYLQELGFAAREVLGEDIWVISVMRKINTPSRKYVITDVRFENEAIMIKQLGGQIWRIRRNDVGPINDHISEIALDDYKFDQILKNEGSLEDLKQRVDERMKLVLNDN
jgi:dephospho-CoA kinase